MGLWLTALLLGAWLEDVQFRPNQLASLSLIPFRGYWPSLRWTPLCLPLLSSSSVMLPTVFWNMEDDHWMVGSALVGPGVWDDVGARNCRMDCHVGCLITGGICSGGSCSSSLVVAQLSSVPQSELLAYSFLGTVSSRMSTLSFQSWVGQWPPCCPQHWFDRRSMFIVECGRRWWGEVKGLFILWPLLSYQQSLCYFRIQKVSCVPLW